MCSVFPFGDKTRDVVSKVIYKTNILKSYLHRFAPDLALRHSRTIEDGAVLRSEVRHHVQVAVWVEFYIQMGLENNNNKNINKPMIIRKY